MAFDHDYGPRRERADAFDKLGQHGPDVQLGPLERVLKREAIVAQVVAGGATSGTARFRVISPSSRLRIKIGVSFFPQVPSDVITLSAQTVTLTPYFTDVAGQEAPADTIVDDEELPYAYEGETSAEAFRGEIALVSTGGTSLAGYYKAVVTWEAPEDMSDGRWRELAGRCSVQALNTTLPLIAPGASP